MLKLKKIFYFSIFLTNLCPDCKYRYNCSGLHYITACIGSSISSTHSTYLVYYFGKKQHSAYKIVSIIHYNFITGRIVLLNPLDRSIQLRSPFRPVVPSICRQLDSSSHSVPRAPVFTLHTVQCKHWPGSPRLEWMVKGIRFKTIQLSAFRDSRCWRGRGTRPGAAALLFVITFIHYWLYHSRSLVRPVGCINLRRDTPREWRTSVI